MLDLYYDILEVKRDASLEQIKKAYRRLIRLNHPDLFPPEERELQELKTMELNDAYRQVTKHLSGYGMDVPRAPSPATSSVEPVLSQSRDIGEYRDPAYYYYKQGFVHFSSGLGGMADIQKHRNLTRDRQGLERAVYSLREFHQAHQYFKRVIDDFPDSMWTRDAGYKLRRIAGYNRVYKKIRENLAEFLLHNDE